MKFFKSLIYDKYLYFLKKKYNIYNKYNYLYNKNINKYKKKIIIYEGPPSMNGKPGVHHLLSKIIKDIYVRYNLSKNFIIKRKLGWDTHGLPIELVIEKEINYKKKYNRYKYLKKFIFFCKRYVFNNIIKWRKITYKIGCLNFNSYDEYYTCNDSYIESLWFIISFFYKKKILYKDYKVQAYSPLAKCELSDNELNFSNTYKKINCKSIYLLFKIKNNFLNYKNINLLVWTTTPWTLASNSALVINKKIKYVLIKTFNILSNKIIYLIFCQNKINFFFNKKIYYKKKKLFNFCKKKKKIPYYIIKKNIKGKNLINIKYKQIIKWIIPYKNNKNFFKIYNANYVSSKEGTGIVHLAPNFGIDDYLLAKKKNIPFFLYKRKNKKYHLVNKKGKYIKYLPKKFRSRYIYKSFIINNNKKKKYKSLNNDIIKYLINKNKIFKIENIKHKYPHCWRTGGKVLFYPIKSWFISINKIKKKILLNINKINWINNIGKKKFTYWVTNSIDWNITRSKLWGTPLPIWISKDKKEILVIKSKKHLIKYIKISIKKKILKKNILKKITLHKDYLDKIILFKNNKKLYREKYVIDVWLDSGSMPYAQFNFPFKNKKFIINNKYYPSNFICEGIDQIRGWFFTLYIISLLFINKLSITNILVTGLILDKYGKKMSKSKNNTINPNYLIKKYGIDIIRFYFIFNNKPWVNFLFNEKTILNLKNKFFNTIINVYNFFKIYINIDNLKINYIDIKYLNFIDKWILSHLNKLILKINKYYKNYNFYKVSKILYNFINKKLSNWYIRISRYRFWKSSNNIYKKNIYNILYLNIKIFLKVLYPICPYISLYILKLLNYNKNIIFPYVREKFINNNIEKIMYITKKICSIILSIRKKNKLKVRLPLSKVYIYIKNKIKKKYIKDINNIIKRETNIKKIYFVKEKKIILKYKVVPNYKILGPKYKKNIINIINIIKKMSIKDINFLNKNKYFKIFYKKKKYVIYKKEIKFILLNDKYINIYKNKKKKIIIKILLNIIITSLLLIELFIKDFINKVQKIRKYYNFNIIKKINIYIFCNIFIKNIIIKYLFFLKNELLIYNIYIYNNIYNNIKMFIF
ncbi:MAG: isoleucine--tRNA ligase [Candidatus Shikimatogenerans sp. Tduv]|uniref:Isoleucine--tRNA ligase n=1 Tax=Candidatus Shikimatogenerans sp. Tduv TaxID=3158567 RepID=A0AAU7QRV7_9FLAO